MFHGKSFLYLIFLPFILVHSQLHLHYTNLVSKNDTVFQHNCLRIAIDFNNWQEYHKIVYFCLSESPSIFHINKNDSIQKYTFAELTKQNITSEQLYHWSAPIDMIEDYQLYLNNPSLENQVFYNCTLPKFGPKCQYELQFYHPNKSIHDFIYNYYSYYPSDLTPTSTSCYIHLKCNRGSSSICLDWTEICDGFIDCLDDGLDEENCWQLDTNDCEDDEYRCQNEQYIPKLFYKDDYVTFDCIDHSDEIVFTPYSRPDPFDRFKKTIFAVEDIVCQRSSFRNSCDSNRYDFIIKALSSTKTSDMSETCWSALKCVLHFLDRSYLSCDEFCQRPTCIQIMDNTCPKLIFFPNSPVLFGDVYLALATNESYSADNIPFLPLHVCYNNSHYDQYFITEDKIFFNNMTCIKDYSHAGGSSTPPHSIHDLYARVANSKILQFKSYHQRYSDVSTVCNTSKMYRCARSSKCISIYRIRNGVFDCPYDDDEHVNMSSTMISLDRVKKTLFQCELSDNYIPYTWIQNGRCDCPSMTGICEDENLELAYRGKNILFQHVCDGSLDLFSSKNQSDEDEFQYCDCDNIYTHCNNIWNCPDGTDETDCFLDSTLQCSSNHQLCVSPQTNLFICLSIDQVNDSIIDCLSAMDEPTLMCPKGEFYCRNQPSQSCISVFNLCNGQKDCEHGDDEQFCETTTSDSQGSPCYKGFNGRRTNVEQYFCSYTGGFQQRTIKHFTIDKMITAVQTQTINSENLMLIQTSNQYQQRCHRGLDLRVWLDTKNSVFRDTCLCMPSYYGDRCQYQNQRIYLILNFQALSYSLRTLFAIVIQLIDDSDDRIIHSYEQLTYLSIRDCQTKFNIYLLYSTRLKNLTRKYAIHLDIYEKETFIYRGSVLFPIQFSFLPVHHLPLIIQIPRNNDKIRRCFNYQCIHGKCMKYLDNRDNLTFCQCKQGWRGKYCTIKHSCTCSSDSLCIGLDSMNRSICICPLNRFGPRCLLTSQQCSICDNGGQCIVNDDYLLSNQTVSCICPKNFTGDRFGIPETKLILSFNQTILLSQHMFIHFIEVNPNVIQFQSTVRSTTFRTISSDEEFFTIYWSNVFHLVFIELFNKTYYLTSIQPIYNQSSIIKKTIQPSDRCPNIIELFNSSFVQLNLARGIKYYHLPCQNQSLNLFCFYDAVHLCLCYQFGRKRLANCFRFDHQMTFDCQGQNECENDGQCFQDHPTCPRKSLCICRECFYGKRCQFNTNEFGVSLDVILGYHIQANVRLSDQSAIVQFSLALTSIFVLLGLVNGILCLITFKNKIVCEVGCGLYLLGSSITALLITMTFGLKFFLLLFTQMNLITNKRFLIGQCYIIDFFLRIFLNMDQWFIACVAAERAMTIIQGAKFDKKKSRKTAILVILMLVLIIIVTCIHDPLSRQLIDETNYDDEKNTKKIWCIVNYQSTLHIYNNIIHALHFIIPFLVNLLSAIILIRTKARQQLSIHPLCTYRETFWKELKKHQYLIIAPSVLVILGVPRLILIYISQCLNSTTNAWIFLLGYFLSFIPSMVTFIVFICPSKFYKREFKKTIKQYQTFVRTRLLFRE